MPIGKQEEKMVNLQHQLRENQRDLQDFLSDMNSWEEEIRQKENNLKKEKPVNEIKLPPVRNSLDKKKHKKKRKVKSESGNGCQPKRISSYDYRSWDKFDIDKALEDVDGEKETSSSEYETDEEWEMERKKHLAEEEKEKGNGFFRSGDLERAIECYSHGVDLDPTNPLLPANRAMALLKQQKYAAAEVDATTAIALDPMYMKAYMRRASARVGLNKMEEAKTDYQRILTLEPQNKGAKTELEKIEKELKRSEEPQPEVQTFTPSESRIILPAHKPPEQRSKKPLQRIMIEEVGVEEDTGLREAVAKQKALQSEAKQNITKKDEESFEKFVTEPETRNIQIEEISSNPTEGTVSAKQVDDSDVQEVVHVPVTKPDVKTKQNDSQTSVTKPDVKTKQNDSRTSVTKASVPVPSSASMEDIAKKGVPQTSFQFQSDYKVLKHNKEAFYQYFKKISPSNLPNLFGEMLDSDILINILSVIKDFFLPAGEVFEEHLASLAKVKRFDMTAMFLSKKERIVVNNKHQNSPEQTSIGQNQQPEESTVDDKGSEKQMLASQTELQEMMSNETTQVLTDAQPETSSTVDDQGSEEQVLAAQTEPQEMVSNETTQVLPDNQPETKSTVGDQGSEEQLLASETEPRGIVSNETTQVSPDNQPESRSTVVVQDLISHLRKTSSSSPDDINRLAKKYGVS